ncbi:hypothetical protein ACS7SF_21110 (plasmid) [Ralstonia sp. 25C]|uniref:hypothetical protein n=1 Tax=Ralstonia sp. 25C TaxID=3447363 RepID=UPI003F74DB65
MRGAKNSKSASPWHKKRPKTDKGRTLIGAGARARTSGGPQILPASIHSEPSLTFVAMHNGRLAQEVNAEAVVTLLKGNGSISRANSRVHRPGFPSKFNEEEGH